MRAALALVLGCAPLPVLPLPAEWSEGSTVVAVRVGEDGRAIEAAALVPGLQAIGLPAEIGDRIAAFVLPPNAFVDETGAPLSDRTGMRVRIGEVDDGCGRCIAGSPVAPDVVHAGESCPPPLFAEVRSFAVAEDSLIRLDEELDAESVRGQVLLSWPGDCACRAPDPAPGMDLTLALVSGPEGAPVESIARSPEGGVALIGEGLLAHVDPAGRRTDRDPAPFAGRVLAAIGLPNDRFLAASHSPGSLRDTRFDLFDSSLATVASNELLHRPRRMRLLPSGLLMAGRGEVQRASLMSCSAGDRIECRELVPDASAETQLEDVAETSGGLLVALAKSGSLLVFEGESVRALPPILAAITDATAIAALGDRLFACVGTASVRYVLTATVGADRWTVAHSGLRVCLDLVATSAGTMRAELDGGASIEISAGGALIGEADAPDVGRPVRMRRSFADGTEIIVGQDDAVFLRAPNGELSRVHGHDPPRLGFAGAIVAEGERFHLLPAFGEEIPFDGVEVRSLAGAIGPDEIPTAAVIDERGVLAIGTCKSTCTSWARSIGESAIEAIEIPVELAGQRLLGLATAAPGVHVAIGETAIAVIAQGRARPVEIDWKGEPRRLASISASGGIAHAGASGGAVLRVFPFAEPPFAQRIDLIESDPILFDPTQHQIPPITAVRAICADDLVLAARASGSDAEEEAGWIWELREGALEPYRANASAGVARLPSGAPIALVGEPDRLAVISSDANERYGAVHRFGSRSRPFFRAPFTAAAENAGGRILIGASYGRLLLGSWR